MAPMQDVKAARFVALAEKHAILAAIDGRRPLTKGLDQVFIGNECSGV
jgi:hypothetical protein